MVTAQRKSLEIPIADIKPDPRQARRDFDQAKLETLAASIRQDGLLNPILVRPNGRGGGFLLIAGERRWRACGTLGLTKITAVVYEVDELTANVLALTDNIERQDLTPIEEAEGIAALVRKDFGGNITKASTRLGKPPKYVEERLKLLDLPPKVQELVANRRLAILAALVLARLPAKDPERIIRGAEMAIRRNWSAARLASYLQPDDEIAAPNPGSGPANGQKRMIQPETISASVQKIYDDVDRAWPVWSKGVRESMAGQFSSLVDYLVEKIKEARPHHR